MSRVTGPHSSSSDGHGRSGIAVVREYFAAFPAFVRNHGFKGLGVFCLAAVFAFAPLTVLHWWNEMRMAGVLATSSRGPVQVRAGEFQEEQDRDEPGETALLQVVCEVTSFGHAAAVAGCGSATRSRRAV